MQHTSFYEQNIQSILQYYGMVEAGYGDLTHLPEQSWQYLRQRDRLPRCISFAYPLADPVMDQVADKPGPTQAYADLYNLANETIDKAGQALKNFIQSQGFQAMPVPASQRVDDQNFAAVFPHKTGATRAGLGWIGKTALFVNRKYGPRVRLGTVLTDMPLSTAKPMDASRCGRCDLCVRSCPAQAASGQPWHVGLARDNFFSVRKCEAYKEKNFYEFNEGKNCAICVAVCPFGKKNKEIFF